MGKATKINREAHGRNGVVVLWEQDVAPSKKNLWVVQVGATKTPHNDFMSAYSHYEEAAA